jgi:hypothetical protein
MRDSFALACLVTLATACSRGSPDPAGWPAGAASDAGSTLPAVDSGAGRTDAGPGVHDSGKPPADAGADASTDGGTSAPPPGFVFSPYKDTSIDMNWNTNVISTMVPGSATPLATDMAAAGAKAITLAFATGECGSENWGGVPGADLATANVSLLAQAGVKYVVSTGGAAGSFTCGSDAGMETFLGRWSSPGLVGVDFDIEAGQTTQVIADLIARIGAAHGTHPGLRFSLTLATLANNAGAATATSLGSAAQDGFNTYGDEVMAAVKSTLGFDGSPATWPGYVTVDLMTMDYGSPSPGVCVVSGGACDMGQSALQAAYDLHDVWGVPYSAIELTPMVGQNDASSEQFTLADSDTVAAFALAQGLAGVHYWSYDRDTDCAAGSASATCSSMGSGYAGAHGFLQRFIGAGLH